MNNYTLTHLHSIYSVGDSTTPPELYIERAKECGMKAITFTEHGNVYNFIKKKQLCDKAEIKFILGVETYLTKTHEEKVKDNYHTILIAKNKSGIEELLEVITMATDKEHTYYRPRLSFEEFCNLSDNIITTSACLGSPLANLDENDEWYEKLINRYDYLEIQPHSVDRQINYNKKLFKLAQKYDKPLISGTDVHEINSYKQECRAIWLIGKGYDDDVREFDLTFKSYDELVDMYKKQNALPDEVWLEAIENTNRLADSVDDFELDYSFKYPDIYSNPYDEMFKKAYDELNRQIENGILADNMFDVYSNRIDEELQVFDKQGMCSFILFMSQLLVWCREQGIPIGFGRGSVTGSLVCYLLKITDVDAIEWKTNFARFVNDGRISLGDIDTDVSPDDRAKVYAYIRNQFTDEKSAYITTFQKLKVNRIIDDVGRALNMPEYEKAKIKKGYNDLELKMKAIQKEFENDKITQKEFDAKELEIEKEIDEYMSQFKDVFQYYKGLSGAISAVGIHACGMIGSPINLISSIGLYKNEKKDCWVSQCDMKNVDSVNYVKYDILSLKTLQVVRDAFKMAGRKYPSSYEINWKDEKVFEDMITSPVGLFQMESQSSFEYLKKLKPKSVEDISFVNAIIRPSCASFRDNAIQKILNKNPTKEIDELLSSTYGYLIYQEQIIEFLQKICGFTASEADTIRRAIGKKDKALLDMWLPKVEEGYVKNSSKTKEEATKDFHTFYIILQQASDYGFSRNHSIAYSMMTYLTAYVRYYYPKEFICAYMNNATDESDTTNAIILSRLKSIDIMPAKYGYSMGNDIVCDDILYKGVKNVLNVSEIVGDDLYQHSKENSYNSFIEALDGIMKLASTNKTNIETLIKIDYFSEFGKAKKLLKLFQIYQDMQGRKQMNKDSKVLQDRPGIKKLIIKKLKDRVDGYSCTPKMYKIDWLDIVSAIENMLPDEDFSVKERIENQLSYLHYIKDEKLKRYQIGIVKFKSKYDSWCIKIGDNDFWYKNLSGKEIDRGDLILINNASEYKDKRGRIQRNLMDIDVLNLDRRKQDKK